MVNIAKIYANSSAQYEYEFAYSALFRVIIGQGQKKASGITSGSLSILYLLTLNIIGVLRVTTQISLYRGTKSHHSSERDEESGLNLIYLWSPLRVVGGELFAKLLACEEDTALYGSEGKIELLGDLVILVAGYVHVERHAILLTELRDGGGDLLHGY